MILIKFENFLFLTAKLRKIDTFPTPNNFALADPVSDEAYSSIDNYTMTWIM